MALWLLAVNPIQVAPHFWAEIDATKGQVAYDACMVKTESSFACEPVRQSAIIKDAQDRFTAFFTEIYYRRNGYGQSGITRIMQKYKLTFVP